jgi:hypothetical protein
MAIRRVCPHLNPHPTSIRSTSTQTLTIPTIPARSRYRIQVPSNAQIILQRQRGRYRTRCTPWPAATRAL